jgi:hypothetical protein
VQILTEITASISTLMMGAVSSSKMSVNIYNPARCNIPEDSHLHAVYTWFSLQYTETLISIPHTDR